VQDHQYAITVAVDRSVPKILFLSLCATTKPLIEIAANCFQARIGSLLLIYIEENRVAPNEISA
jgi:hypothetical protein